MTDPRVIDTIVAEAIGDGDPGLTAVAAVIANRAAQSGKDPLAVVSAPRQFAGYSNPGSSAQKAMNDPAVRARVEQIWDGVTSGLIPDPTDGGIYFHSVKSSPAWAAGVNKNGTVQIGGQTFYRGPGAQVEPASLAAPVAVPLASSGGLNILDLTAGGQTIDGRSVPANSLAGRRRGGDIKGLVFHHSAGTGLVGAMTAGQGDGKQKGTGAQLYIDTDGTVYRYAPDTDVMQNIKSPGNKHRTDTGQPTATLSNDTVIGVEIIAPDSKHFTQAQKEAAAALSAQLASQYHIPSDMIVGHGQLQGGAGGNKQADEGIPIAEFARNYIAGKIPPGMVPDEPTVAATTPSTNAPSSAVAAIDAAAPRPTVSSAAAGYTPAVTVAPTLQAAAETAAARMRVARAPAVPSLEARDEAAARRPQVGTVAPTMVSTAGSPGAPPTARPVVAPPLPPPPRSPIFDALGLPNPGVTVVDGMQHNARDLAQRQAAQAELDARGADIIGAGPTATGVMRQADEPASPFGALDIFRALGLRNPGETVADAIYDRSLPKPDVTARPASGTPRGKEPVAGVTAPAATPASTASQAAPGSFTGDLVAFLEERARAKVPAKPATPATTKAAPGRPSASAVDPTGTAPTSYGVRTALHPEKVASAKDELRTILAGSVKPDADRIDVVSRRGSDPVGTGPTAQGVSKVAQPATKAAAAKQELTELLKPATSKVATAADKAWVATAAAPGKAAATMTAAVNAKPAGTMTAPGPKPIVVGASRDNAILYGPKLDAKGQLDLGNGGLPPRVTTTVPRSVSPTPVTRAASQIPVTQHVEGQEVAAPRNAVVAPKIIPAGYSPIVPMDMTLDIPDVGAASRAKVTATIPQTQAEKDWAQTGFDKPVVAPAFTPSINNGSHAATSVATAADAAWGAQAQWPGRVE